MLILYFFIAFIGLIIGSFLTMLSYRLPRGLSLLGRSLCASCNKTIVWYQNIPIIYYLISGGKCGLCKSKISLRYPIIEISTSLVFLATALLWSQPGSLAVSQWSSLLGIVSLPFYLLLTTFYLLLIITDFEHQILPDIILVFMGLLTIVVLLFYPSPTLFTSLFFGYLVFLFFLLIYLVTRGRGMGFGDVKMSFVMGSLLGYPYILVWLFGAFFTGAIVGLVLMIFGKAKIGKPIPFGPFLLASAWFTFFYGDKIWRWYTGMTF